MLYIASLFYFEPTSLTAFGRRPNGAPDVKRLIEGKPAYRQSRSDFIPKKKTIVISLSKEDISELSREPFPHLHTDDELIFLIYEHLKLLKANHFEYFVLSDNQLIPSDKIDHENDLYSSNNTISIYDVLAEQHEPIDHFIIFGKRNITDLILGKYANITLADHPKLNPAYLNLINSPIIDDQFENMLQKYQDQIKALNIVCTLNLAKPNLPHGQFEQLEKLVVGSSAYRFYCHFNNDRTYVNTKINIDILKQLIQKSPYLTHLLLDFFPQIDGTFFKNLKLNRLRNISLIGIKLSDEMIANLKYAAPQITILSISCLSHFNIQLLNSSSFPNLQAVVLCSLKETDQEQIKQLIHTTNLKALHINDSQLNPKAFTGIQFTTQEKIWLEKTDVSKQSFEMLWNNSTCLKHLALQENTIIYDELKLNKEQPKIRLLNLSGSHIKANALRAMISRCPNLTVLCISVHSKDGDKLLSSISHSNIQSLNLSGKGFTSDGIDKLIKQCPSLNQIQVGGIRLDKNQLNFLREKYRHIKFIEAPSAVTRQKTMNTKKFQPENNVHHVKTGSQFVDANTVKDENKAFNINRIFMSSDKKHPAPSSYRLNVYDQVEINQSVVSIKKAFVARTSRNDLIDVHDIKVHNRSIYDVFMSHSRKNTYFGKVTVTGSSKPIPLPSLSPEDKITDLFINTNSKFQIKYSKITDLYYIQLESNTSSHIEIELVLTSKINRYKLPNKIQKLVNHLNHYKAGALTGFEENTSGHSYYHALKKQKKGACRHRAMIFKRKVSKWYPQYECRVVFNQVHAFAELKYRGRWQTIDLGGYPAKVNIRELQLKSTIAKPTENIQLIESLPKAKYFNPISTTEPTFESPSQMFEGICNHADNNILINASKDTLEPLLLNIQRHCQKNHTPFFYIHKAEDIACQSAYIRKDGDKGYTMPGPGGALHDFLSDIGDQPKVLLVNYNQFSNDELVAHNSLIDEHRRADGTYIPEHITIIGVINRQKPNVYQGGDFYSRFDQEYTNPFDLLQLEIPELQIEQAQSSTNESDEHIINLYSGDRWQERLIGSWVLDGEQLKFKEGALISAIKHNAHHIHFIDPPVSQDFSIILKSFLLNRKIVYQGINLGSITENLTMSYSKSDLKKLSFPNFVSESEIKYREFDYVLNFETLHSFYETVEVNALQQLIRKPGILEQNRGKTISILLTAQLSVNQIKYFHDQCHENNVFIELVSTPNIKLPTTTSNISVTLKPYSKDAILNQPVSVIYAEDEDVALLSLPNNDAQIIDVTDLKAEDIFDYHDGQFDEQTNKFSFSKVPSFLKKSLQDGKHVVLKGQYNQSLRDALQVFLLNCINHAPIFSGKLTVITKNQHDFIFCTQLEVDCGVNVKQDLLRYQFAESHVDLTASAKFLAMNSLAVLFATFKYIIKNPNVPYKNNWLGITNLPPVKPLMLANIAHYPLLEESFIQNRLDAVKIALESNPYVFLAGPTGAGKTTFVHQNLKLLATGFYSGASNISTWAKDNRPGLKLLFIDEANIGENGQTNWSVFEGFFQPRPAIYINQEYILLNPKEHKVIFAGNPSSYAANRNIPNLFRRHGNTVVFEPLNTAVIFNQILKPIFNKYASKLEQITAPILKVAAYLSQQSSIEVLITPREISMIALLTRSHYESHFDSNDNTTIEDIATYFSWAVGRTLVPHNKKDEFENLFSAPPLSTSVPKIDGIFQNQSNTLALQALNAHLTLRQKRTDIFADAIFQTSGLGGVILEGEPGIGKSLMAIKMLQHYGLQQVKSGAEQGSQFYYHLPITMGNAEKTSRLLHAFDMGWVVVMDEVNSCLMLEKLLNDLLMGKHPEGREAKKPGFMFIGTQNPAERYQGRIKASSALLHRIHTIKLPKLNQKEMIDVLSYLKLDIKIARTMVSEYLEWKKTNKQLTFRDLVKCAKKYSSTHPQKRKLEDVLSYSPEFFAENNRPLKERKVSPTQAVMRI